MTNHFYLSGQSAIKKYLQFASFQKKIGFPSVYWIDFHQWLPQLFLTFRFLGSMHITGSPFIRCSLQRCLRLAAICKERQVPPLAQTCFNQWFCSISPAKLALFWRCLSYHARPDYTCNACTSFKSSSVSSKVGMMPLLAKLDSSFPSSRWKVGCDFHKTVQPSCFGTVRKKVFFLGSEWYTWGYGNYQLKNLCCQKS